MKTILTWVCVLALAYGALKVFGPVPIPSSGGAASNAPDGWQTDFATATAQAQKDNKAVLLNFTGSDWCPWCVKMDQEVLETPQFKEFAAQNLELVYVDFPRQKELPAALAAQNNALQQKFAIEGFPSFVLLDSKGYKLAQMVGYQPGGPDAFINQVKQALGKSGS
jgi:protein disulfide-isomerase